MRGRFAGSRHATHPTTRSCEHTRLAHAHARAAFARHRARGWWPINQLFIRACLGKSQPRIRARASAGRGRHGSQCATRRPRWQAARSGSPGPPGPLGVPPARSTAGAAAEARGCLEQTESSGPEVRGSSLSPCPTGSPCPVSSRLWAVVAAALAARPLRWLPWSCARLDCAFVRDLSASDASETRGSTSTCRAARSRSNRAGDACALG